MRITKKPEVSRKEEIKIRALSILFALITSGLFILILSHNPFEVFAGMADGALGNPHRLKSTIIKAIPLVITSLGISVAFKMKFWNIGGEGQILMGAYLATVVYRIFPDLSRPLMLFLMIIAAMIGGGLWALIPAFFRAKWRTNETIITLMMNYIALKWITYLQYSAWKDPSAMGFAKIAPYGENAILPKLFGIHIGWVITIALILVMYFFMNYSKMGYEIAVLGESENTANYAGINVPKTIITAVFISGALCGITGFVQATGVSGNLSVQLTAGVGFTAIITSWLSNLKVPVILVVSFLFAALVQGASYIQIAFGIPDAASTILQSLILFFVLGSEFFIRYRISFKKNK